MFKTTVTSSIIFVSLSSITYAQPYLGASINLGSRPSYGFQNVGASIFGGTGTTVGAKQNIYLGGELNLSYLRNTVVGASFIPGIMLTKNTMLYSRLGLEGSFGYAFKQQSYFNFGTKLGLGIQTKLTKHLDFRTEYSTSRLQHSQLDFGLVYKFS